MIQLVRPHRGPVTQRYGNTQPDGLPHAGQDYGYSDGTNVYPEVFAAADGVVLFAGDSRSLAWPNLWYVNPDFNRNDAQDSSAGNLVIIGHEGGFDTGYAHLESYSVKAGDKVRAGQQIAVTGNTGYSFGKHLHFFLMFRPFNYSTSTYGCSDPNPYLTGGIVLAGTTTSTEEDDMPFTPAEVKQLVTEGVQDYFRLKGEMQDGRNVIDHLNQTRTDVISTKAVAAAIPSTVLFDTKVEGRNLFDAIKQVRTDVFGTRGTSVDVDALAAELAERLEARDLASLAEKLQITVKEG